MVEKFNEPVVSVISVRDDPLLQQERSPHTSDTLREVIAQVWQRQTDLDESELRRAVCSGALATTLAG